MAESLAIKTGVDKLVELVDQKKEISISDAAKILGVPVSVVEEWTDFLEEKGVIKIKYKFTVPYIVKLEVGKGELLKMGKTLDTKKESILRKAEVTMFAIREELDTISVLKTEFFKLSNEISDSSATIKNEIAILERFDSLKKNLEQELLTQQATFKKGIGTLEAQANEKYAEYGHLKNEIEKELERLKDGFAETSELKKQEEAIQEQLDSLLDKQKIIASALSKQDAAIIEIQDRLQLLRKSSEKIGTELMEKMDEAKPVLKNAEAKKNELLASQQKLLDSLSAQHAKVMSSAVDYKALVTKTIKFFSKKETLDKEFGEINDDLENLNKEVSEILRESRVLNALSRSKSSEESIRHLEERIKNLEVRRGYFQKKVSHLITVFNRTAK